MSAESEQNTILLYQAADGKTRLEVQLDHETVWLNLNQMAGCSSAINQYF